jgi:hypothetical protein
MKVLLDAIRELGENPKGELYASFGVIRLQLAKLRETASGVDSVAAKEARTSVLKFAEVLDETGLLDYVVKIRNEAKANPTA